MIDHNLMKLDGKVNVFKTVPYALQQILAMFVTNIVPVITIASFAMPEMSEAEILAITQNAMIVAGIATFVQATPFWKIGSGLPIFMGVSFTFVIVLSQVAATSGYGAVVGAVIAGGFFEGILGLTARFWKKMVAPIVSATVVTGIGLSLLNTAARSFGGGYAEDFGSVPNLIIGTVTIIAFIVWKVFIKGTKKQLSILAGLGVGYITALCFGKVDFSNMMSGGVFALPKILPFKPVFRLDAILSICIIYIVSATETLGDASALASGILGRDTTPQEAGGALTVDGFGSMLGGFFGVSPVTSYSENIGLTIMTKIVNRNVARTGAVIMVICGLFPPIGQFVRTVPVPVIGGILIVVIGQIVVSGFHMIADTGFNARNKLIAALSLGIGIGFTTGTEAAIWDAFPPLVQTIFSQNVVAVVFVISFLLNLILPESMEQEEG